MVVLFLTMWPLLFCFEDEPEPANTWILESSSGTYRFHVRLQSREMPLNQPFRMDIAVEVLTGPDWSEDHRLSVDARMPHHRHGMNRQPLVRAEGEGVYVVESMLLHMPGYWEIYLDVTHEGKTERGQFHVELD